MKTAPKAWNAPWQCLNFLPLQHSAGWLRHRPDQRGGVMGLFRHGPARPGHLLRHVLMGMARTSRAMTPKARRRSVSINLRSALSHQQGAFLRKFLRGAVDIYGNGDGTD